MRIITTSLPPLKHGAQPTPWTFLTNFTKQADWLGLVGVVSIKHCISKVQCEHWPIIFVYNSCFPCWFEWYKLNIPKFIDIIYVNLIGTNNNKMTLPSVHVCLSMTQTKIGKYFLCPCEQPWRCTVLLCVIHVFDLKLQNQRSSITVDDSLWG